MKKSISPTLVFLGLLASAFPAFAMEDTRFAIEMPDMMRTHMLANMRDHLLVIREIQGNLAVGKYEVAADIAENRLGMSSLQSHGASHMAGYMPKGMQETGTAMHKAASRFAVVAQEAAVTRDLPRTLAALSDVTASCVA